MVAITGDFDIAAAEAELKRLTGGWKKKELPRREWPKVEMPTKFTEKVLSMPDAAQLHFYMGHVGIRRSNPDYYRLLVMDYILGTGPGFTSRLSALRDREGLAYTVEAVITSSAGHEPGLFTGYIGTFNENYAKVKKRFLEELNRVRKEKASEKELADAKSYLQGSYTLGYGTNAGIAGQLLDIELHGLGLDHPAKFHKAVGAVTADDVLAVAKKYLHPSKMIVVAAGAVNEKGEPLKSGEKE
jgi:zinc protease